MDQNNTPDSWDQGADVGTGDQDSMKEMAKDLTRLNVNAPAFIPGQNVFATAFVPSFLPNSSGTAEGAEDTDPNQDTRENTSPAAEEQNMDIDQKPVVNNQVEEEAPENWADKAEENGGSPDDGDKGGGASSNDLEDEEDEDEEPVVHLPKRHLSVEEATAKQALQDHLNIVFIGHVDAGKSTIGGHIMYLTGMVEKRTLEKYEREAKEKNRESWYLSWALDTNLEERDKGKTVEVGRAYFETETKHFTILDAPGHKSFVPNMIGGASQADVAVLVISARKGEFETGFERGGQTREHAMLVKTAGVKHLIVVVNKMDDHTVQWDMIRYEEIKDKLTPYLKKCGFSPKNDIFYIPVSGLTGANLKQCRPDLCPWYNGPSLIDYLEKMAPIGRHADGPIRMPIVDRYKDMGTIVLGKVESGVITKGMLLSLMPNKVTVEVMQLWSDEEETDDAYPGANVKLKLKNLEEDDVSSGFVLCSPDNLCHIGKMFDAQIVILEHKSIICAGYSAVMHIHTSAEEVSIKALICLVDRKTGDKSKIRPRFIKQDQIAIVRLEVTGGSICLEAFKEFPQMGRFTLRDEGRTIAIGKVLKILQ